MGRRHTGDVPCMRQHASGHARVRINAKTYWLGRVTYARLVHVAILGDDERPCYPGARAKVFRFAWCDDSDKLRRQIAETVKRCRWYARQARG